MKDNIEEITGMTSELVYAKWSIQNLLDKMHEKYGNDVTSDAFTEVYWEIYGDCDGADDDESADE